MQVGIYVGHQITIVLELKSKRFGMYANNTSEI